MSRSEAQRYLVILRYKSPVLREAIENKTIENLLKGAALAQLPVEELEASIKGNNVKQKKYVVKPNIKVARDSNNSALNKMISAVVEKYNASSVIENLDLKKPKDINLALNALLLFLGDKEGQGDNE
jgi:hypothetical protein